MTLSQKQRTINKSKVTVTLSYQVFPSVSLSCYYCCLQLLPEEACARCYHFNLENIGARYTRQLSVALCVLSLALLTFSYVESVIYYVHRNRTVTQRTKQEEGQKEEVESVEK